MVCECIVKVSWEYSYHVGEHELYAQEHFMSGGHNATVM